MHSPDNYRMKILQLVTCLQFRGAEVSAANLSEGLVRAGVQVVFVGLYAAHKNPLQVKGAKNIDLQGAPGAFSISLLFRLIKLIRQEQPHVLQANGSDTLKYLIAARFFTQKILIVYRNISLISTWMGNQTLKLRLYRWLFQQVSRVVSVGHESREDFIRTMLVQSDRVQVIRRGIPMPSVLTSRGATRQTLGIDANAFVLIHVGNFSPEKNQAFLVEVVSNLIEQLPSVVLLFVGEGSTQAHVKGFVKDRKLEQHIRFLGLRHDIGDLFQASDLNVLCSTVEGVPGVVLEAGMMGLPTVAVAVGGTVEVVLPDQTGVLIHTHAAKQFAEAILTLASRDDQRKQLGLRAREFAMQEFSLEKSVQEFIKLYQGMNHS
jgi:L-malate glycosyltransferase